MDSINATDIIIENATLVTPEKEIHDASLRVSDGAIAAIGSAELRDRLRRLGKEFLVYDAGGRYVTPGFVDLHTNGGGGVEAYDSDLSPWYDFLLRNGVTAFAPTLITRPFDEMIAAARNITELVHSGSAPRVLGVYAEGPFINGRYGQQPAENCIHPADHDYERLVESMSGTRGIVTVAPELPGAEKLIRRLVESGHVAAIGHTGADADTTQRAIDLGATLTSHAACAIAAIHPRWPETREGKYCGAISPGAMEVTLIRDEVFAEVIVDQTGVHVDPVILEMMRRCKPADRLITISDNMASAGMPDGIYETVDGRSYVIDRTKDDLIRLDPDGTLAGVVYPIKDGVRNLLDQTEISFCDAIASVTTNPARLLGIEDSVGRLVVGAHADIAIFDDKWNVDLTMVDGKVVFSSGELTESHGG